MQTHPNMVLLAEDVRAKRWSLHDVVREVADVVQARSEMGKQFGTVLVRSKTVSFSAGAGEGKGRSRESLTVTDNEIRSTLTVAIALVSPECELLHYL